MGQSGRIAPLCWWGGLPHRTSVSRSSWPGTTTSGSMRRACQVCTNKWMNGWMNEHRIEHTLQWHCISRLWRRLLAPCSAKIDSRAHLTIISNKFPPHLLLSYTRNSQLICIPVLCLLSHYLTISLPLISTVYRSINHRLPLPAASA